VSCACLLTHAPRGPNLPEEFLEFSSPSSTLSLLHSSFILRLISSSYSSKTFSKENVKTYNYVNERSSIHNPTVGNLLAINI
jgi:hypothetical protein